jgi:hypothetical protein
MTPPRLLFAAIVLPTACVALPACSRVLDYGELDFDHCIPRTCDAAHADCGRIATGCGYTISCGSCQDGQTCGAAGANRCGVGGACTPQTCVTLGATCGSVSDGCSDVLECGVCATAGEVCGGGGPNRCGSGTCVPKTCKGMNMDCGSLDDGCGSSLSCGICLSTEVCGGGGPNRCGSGACVPKTCADLNAECGAISDGCGATLGCGSCSEGACGAVYPNHCGTTCTPTTCQAKGAECGQIQDGCGSTLSCGTCSTGTCGALQPNHCGAACSPATCPSLGAECGSPQDGCGGTLSCGTCTTGTCAAGNKCVASCSYSSTVTTRKYFLLYYNPILESQAGQRLIAFKGWNSPVDLVKTYEVDVCTSSHGEVKYVQGGVLEIDGYPIKEDGYQYTDATFLACLGNVSMCHKPGQEAGFGYAANYNTILTANAICDKLNAHTIDELWIFGAPYMGLWEANQAGTGAFSTNGPIVTGTTCQRILNIMGFSYERGVAEMLEDLGHRTEGTMREVFGGETGDWGKFIRYDKTYPGGAHCGTVHYAPNSNADYDWGNTSSVMSYCDAWNAYPNLTGAAKAVTCSTWKCNALEHKIWWLSHLPHVAGTTLGKSNNWWTYVTSDQPVK